MRRSGSRAERIVPYPPPADTFQLPAYAGAGNRVNESRAVNSKDMIRFDVFIAQPPRIKIVERMKLFILSNVLCDIIQADLMEIE